VLLIDGLGLLERELAVALLVGTQDYLPDSAKRKGQVENGAGLARG
jgi:hypothetical protein